MADKKPKKHRGKKGPKGILVKKLTDADLRRLASKALAGKRSGFSMSTWIPAPRKSPGD